MAETMSRLTLPTSTMRAMSRVSASVTRRPVDELGDLAQPGHELADLRAAAVDDERPHPDGAHEHDVGGEGRQRLRSVPFASGEPACERVAAVLDDHDLAPEAPDVRQGLDQDAGFLGGADRSGVRSRGSGSMRPPATHG